MALELTAADVERQALAEAQKKYLKEQETEGQAPPSTHTASASAAAPSRIGFWTIVGAIVLGNVMTGIIGGIVYAAIK
jgi:hypothetical protein